LLKRPSDGHNYLLHSRRFASSDKFLALLNSAGLDDTFGSIRHDNAENDGPRGAAYQANSIMTARAWGRAAKAQREPAVSVMRLLLHSLIVA